MKNIDITKKIIDTLKEASYKCLYELDVASEDAYSVNKNLLFRILNDNKNTEFGKKYGFLDIHDVEKYKKTVPISTYEDYNNALIRMTENGEENIITAYPIVFYARTSGTTGNVKKIPVSDRCLELFRKYGSSVMLSIISEFYKNTKMMDVPYGSRLMIASFSKIPLKNGINFGSLSATCIKESDYPMLEYFIPIPIDVMLCSEPINSKYFYARYGLADRDVVYFTGSYIPALLDLVNYIRSEWPMLVEDIRKGKINKDVLMPNWLRKKLELNLVPDPERADELEKEFSKGFGDKILKHIWPKLSAVCAIWAGNFSIYAHKLQIYTGRAIPYFTMSYVSSEGIFAVARHPFDQYFVLIPQSCFFEFIPQSDKNNDEKNPDTVLMEELQQGKDYEIVITNQSGFYRYRLGDVIRIVGFYNECPMIEFRYRKKNVMSIYGENFSESDLYAAIQEFEHKTGIIVIDYCIFPDRDSEPPKYIIYIEPDKIVPAQKLEKCKNVLFEALIRASADYAHYITSENIKSLELIFLKKGSFQLHREIMKNKWGGSEIQIKPVRVLDNLEQVSFFNTLKESYNK